MKQIILITIKSIIRDRVFLGIAFAALIFLLIPSISSLSMRQSTELSITLSLSLISFILLLLSVFLGGTSIWRDIDRRYTYSILSLPVARTAYIVGRFLGNAMSLLLVTIILGIVATCVIWITSTLYPPERPVNWCYISIAIFFESLKYILLTACAFFFSTFSTSFFLPVFGTISIFFAGSAMQEVYQYVNGASAAELSLLLKDIVSLMYFILPNFSSFDFQVYAIYGVTLQIKGILLTVAYFSVYTLIVMTISSIVFQKREIK